MTYNSTPTIHRRLAHRWLVALLLLVLMPVAAKAVIEDSDAVFTYKCYSGKGNEAAYDEPYCFITGIKEGAVVPEDMVIADYFHGYAVRGFGYDAIKGQTAIKTLTLGANVNAISAGAFEGCSNLEKITFKPLTLDAKWYAIESRAFAGSALRSVELPEGYTGVWADTFEDCYYLRSITLPSTLKYIQRNVGTNSSDKAFGGCYLLEVINLKSAEVVGSYKEYEVMLGALGEAQVVVPDELVSSYKNHDYWKTYADNIHGETASAVGDRFVYNDENASMVYEVIDAEQKKVKLCSRGAIELYNEKVELPQYPSDNAGQKWKQTSIDSQPFLYVFEDFSGLTLPKTLERIEGDLFYVSSNLLGKEFGKCNVSLIDIGLRDNLSYIAPGAFKSGNRLSIFGKNDYYDEYSNTFLIKRSNGELTHICPKSENSATLTIPIEIKRIGEDAFAGVKAKSVIFQSTMEYIGSNTFDSSISNFTFYTPEPPTMDTYFPKNSTFKVLPCALEAFQNAKVGTNPARNLKDFATIETLATEELGGFAWKDDASGVWLQLVIKDNETTAQVIASQDGDYAGDIVIPGEATPEAIGQTYRVTMIGEGAFKGATGLTSVSIPFNMNRIKNYAFYECTNLKTVNFDTDVTGYSMLEKIGLAAFEYSGITSFNMPQSVTELGPTAFGYCENLTDVTLGELLTELPVFTFQSCKALKEIVVPINITKVGHGVFTQCESLENIIFRTQTVPEAPDCPVFPYWDYDVTYEALRRITLWVPARLREEFTTAESWKEFYNIRPDYRGVKIVNKYNRYTEVYYIEDTHNLTAYFAGATPNEEGYRANVYLDETITYRGETYNVTSIANTLQWQQDYTPCIDKIIIDHDIDDISYRAFYESDIVEQPDLTHVRKLWARAFEKCKLAEMSIPYQVKEIGKGCFDGMPNLTTLTIESPVTKFADDFKEIPNLSVLTLPSTLESIDGCFMQSDAITEVHLRAMTPPAATIAQVQQLAKNGGKLYVPTGTKAAYQATNWQYMGNIIEENIPVVNITLDQNAKQSDLNWKTNQLYNVTLKRDVLDIKLWNSFVVPFDISPKEIAEYFGAGTRVYEYTGNSGSKVSFKEVSAITAGVPCVLLIKKDKVDFSTITFMNKYLNSYDDDITTEGSGFDYVGLYSPVTINSSDYFFHPYRAGTAFANPGSSFAKRYGYSAYLKYTSAGAKEFGGDIEVYFDGVSTGIMTVDALGNLSEAESVKVYGLNGQYLGDSTEGLPKGIYVVNGKKVVVE